VAVPALALLLTRLARSVDASAPHTPAREPEISTNRPSGPPLTTGVVPVPVGAPQH
jgi:hypothetical protein